MLSVPGLVVVVPEVELPGLELLDDEDDSEPGWVPLLPLPEVPGYELLPAPEPIVSDELDELPRGVVLSVSVDDEPTEPEFEPELIVPGLLPEDELSGRAELAPEPAPEPMLPEPMLPEVEPPEGGDDERSLDELELAPGFFCHFWNSDCDSEPSLLASAVVNAVLSSDCIAASVCEMRPSRFASSDLKVAVAAEPEPDVPEPAPMLPLVLLCGELLDGVLPEPMLPWLGDDPELLWPYAVAAITAAATALINTVFFMANPRKFEGWSTGQS